MWGYLCPKTQIRNFAEMVMMGYGADYNSFINLEPWKMNVILMETANAFKEKIEAENKSRS